jgi:hypothetical protein
MTITVSGSLHYGYDLGSPHGWEPIGWTFDEVTTAGVPALAWFDPTTEQEFDEQCHRHLLADVDGVDLDEGWPDLRELAATHVGAVVHRYCGEYHPSLVLSAFEAIAFYDSPEEIDPLDLERRRVAEGWDGRLAAVLGRLGITPRIRRPRWLLTSAE